MARRRYQCGCVILKGQVWYGKYRDDVVEQDGTVTRVQRRTPLGTKKEYPPSVWPSENSSSYFAESMLWNIVLGGWQRWPSLRNAGK